MIPTDRKYTAEHEWIMIEGNVAKIGITDHAQSELGDIVFVELPVVGDSFSMGDSIATVESVKAVSNIYSIVSGKVIEVNDVLDETPEALNEAAYDNFLVAIEIESIDEGKLITADEYKALIDAEG